ncbi:MAG: OsmC family protein [Gaiellales bacterium]
MDLREVQAPLKEEYRRDPAGSRIVLRAQAGRGDEPVACAVDIGRAVHQAQAHSGVGGPGTGACSGDLLLGALAACAQLTCQMVAESMGLETRDIHVTVTGALDLRGTLGIDREVPVGFQDIDVEFQVDAPAATAEQLEALRRRTERYCVVMRTLTEPPPVRATWG